MKDKLQKILENPANKLFAIDMDETICRGQFWGENDEPEPIPEMIAMIWEWYKKGAHVIIYTARHPRYFSATNAWLIKYDVPFHGIAMQRKVGADIYIDDKALNVEDILCKN